MNKKHELSLLKLRNLIACKEAAIATANQQSAHGDGWLYDWTIGMAEYDDEINDLIAELEGE